MLLNYACHSNRFVVYLGYFLFVILFTFLSISPLGKKLLCLHVPSLIMTTSIVGGGKHRLKLSLKDNPKHSDICWVRSLSHIFKTLNV